MTTNYEVIGPGQRHFVSKPWGWEDWILNDEAANLCQKILFVKGGRGGSIHRHIKKDEVITCESGQLIVEVISEALANSSVPPSQTGMLVGTNRILIPPGVAIRIRPGVWHRLSAGYDTYVYEASTWHDDNDVERADDWTAAMETLRCSSGSTS
jgi:D-lyxose ketol-isomerase